MRLAERDTISQTQETDQSGAMFFFLMCFIIMQTMIFINLFIAVIVNNVESVNVEMSRQRIQEERDVDNSLRQIDPRLLSANSVEVRNRKLVGSTSRDAEGSKTDVPEKSVGNDKTESKGAQSLHQLHGYEYFHPRDKELLME